jgi:hypothetical protein
MAAMNRRARQALFFSGARLAVRTKFRRYGGQCPPYILSNSYFYLHQAA